MLYHTCLKKGSGVPRVFIHGFLGNARDWEGVVNELPFHSIGIDLPGHGDSPFTADFESAFCEATKDLPPFHLIGYSMGGRLGAEVFQKHPDRIKSLTILAAHPGLKTDEERKTRLKKDQLVANKILELSIDQFLKEWYDQPLFHTLTQKMDICSMRKKQNPNLLVKAILAFSLGQQTIDICKRATLLVGENDAKYRALYKDLKHTVIPNASHAIHLENPSAVARSLL